MRQGNRHMPAGVSRRLFPAVSLVLLLGIGFMGSIWAGSAPATSPREERDVRSADQAFVNAAAKSDTRILSTMIAPDFTWTDATGRTIDKSHFLHDPTQAAVANGETKLHDYGTVIFLTGAARIPGEHVRVVRVWVKQAGGWRILLVQQTMIEGEKKKPQATVKAGTLCENPCKSVPYQPQTAAQGEVVASWQGLETAVNQRNADEWARHVGDEFVFNVKENGNPLTKADRVATIRKQAQGDTVTDIGAVVPGSMAVDVFGDTAVMRDTQQPTEGERPYRAMRVWVKRDGRWQLVYSQQTTIQK
ncbi:MAG TPA: nuclear transport factor 2 family protein [Terriglobales bacterium]|nr:nuclear transport factor 2 family protein [Terriglobales bacterium]